MITLCPPDASSRELSLDNSNIRTYHKSTDKYICLQNESQQPESVFSCPLWLFQRKLTSMCITNALQQKIRKHTENGDLIAQFLADTIRGEYPDAKYHHKLEAAKLLSRYDSPDDSIRHSCGSRNPAGQGEGHGEGNSQFWGLIPTPEELAAKKEDQQSPLSPRERARVRGEENPYHPENHVTHLDILNYEIAHLIRQETAEGHTIAEFLSHVMTRRDQPFTPKKLRIRHADRMAAAREILRRGHGHWGRKPKLKVYADDVEDTNDYDTLHTDLAKRMREYNEHGTEAIRFLLDVMNDTSLDPEEGYTWHHKMSAAHELTRRGWDTNYDKITPEMLQAYWQDQQSTRLSIGQKKQLAGLPAFLDEYDHYDTTDYQAIANEIREAEAREEAQSEHPTKNPPLPTGEGWGEGLSESLPPRRGKARMGVTAPTISPSDNNETLPNRHSCESRNPAGQGAGTETTNPFVLSPVLSQSKGLSKDEPASSPDNTEDNTSSPSFTPMSVPFNEETTFTDDDLDCYYEPLTPEDQAIFNYNSLIESGEFEEGEITFVPPSEAAHCDYAIALKQIREAAEADGVPLLPNPLAGTLRRPKIRSP